MTQAELCFDAPAPAGQCADVLAYIREFGSITALDAMRDLGIMRLASRISDLRRDGYNIQVSRKEVKNRWNKTCYIAEYKI